MIAALAAERAPAQPPAAGSELATWSRTLLHQPVAEAVALVYPLLSDDGRVEVRPGDNALVVRDLPAVVARVAALLDDFDHPALGVDLEVRIVGAGPDGESGAAPSGLPPELVARLKELLRFSSYRLMAAARLAVAEGSEVSRRLGDEYRVDFRMGRLEADRRIKLHGFRIFRGAEREEPKPLIHTNINLRLDQPMVLGLARTEASERALMVVLNCSRPAAAANRAEER